MLLKKLLKKAMLACGEWQKYTSLGRKSVPNSSTHKVISSRGLFQMDSMVSCFIHLDKSCWNLDLLKQAFLRFEPEEIAGIPLSIQLPDDKQVWGILQMGCLLLEVLINWPWM